MGLPNEEEYEATLWACPSRVNMIYDDEDDIIVLIPTDNEDIDREDSAIAFTACHALEVIDLMRVMVEKALEIKEALKEGASKGPSKEEIINQFEDPMWADVAEEIVQRAARGEAV